MNDLRGQRCWFQIEGIEMGGLVVSEEMDAYGEARVIVKLDIPILCIGGCKHTHAAPAVADVILES